MNKKVLVLALAVAMLALPLSAVSATKPMPVAGQFFPTAEPGLSPSFAGKSANNFLTITEGYQMWTGSFEGTANSHALWIIHKAGDPEAPGWHITVARAVFELDIVFDGKEGTLTLKAESGNWRIMSGTGELANLRGQGKLTVINAELMMFGYEGQVHFEP
jgi:hypothetical protein